jgi:hypothetical protein
MNEDNRTTKEWATSDDERQAAAQHLTPAEKPETKGAAAKPRGPLPQYDSFMRIIRR